MSLIFHIMQIMIGGYQDAASNFISKLGRLLLFPQRNDLAYL